MACPHLPGAKQAGVARHAAVLAVLRSDPLRDWTAPDVHDLVKKYGSLEKVRATLRRLRDKGDIVVVESGGGARPRESTYRAAVVVDGSWPMATREVCG